MGNFAYRQKEKTGKNNMAQSLMMHDGVCVCAYQKQHTCTGV